MMFRFNSEDGDIMDVIIDRTRLSAEIEIKEADGLNARFAADELRACAALLIAAADVMERLEEAERE